MNICLFSMKLPILVKISHTIIETLTLSQWSSKFTVSTSVLSYLHWATHGGVVHIWPRDHQLLSGQLVCVLVWRWTEDILNTFY